MSARAIAIAGLLLGLTVSVGNASERIGEATSAKNEVVGTLGDVVRAIGVGDGVSGNEIVKTGVDSATLLRFLDSSNLNIGASSTIVLDRFVFNPDGSADTVVMNLTKGALRFVSGRSDPTKFMVKTQVATLGVLGTDFVTLCDGSDRCAVVVAKGKVRVCPHPEPLLDCSDAYNVDVVRNFTIVGPNGQNTGARTVPPGLVAAIIRAVANGRSGLTIASIESGYFGTFDTIFGPGGTSIESARTLASPQ
jgi:FecR protein